MVLPAVGRAPKSNSVMSASGDSCPVEGDFAFRMCLGLGAFQWMDRLLKTLPGSEVGNESEPPEESEITARLAYVAMTATTSKLAANMPRLRVNGGAFFASPHRILLLTPSSDCSTVSAFAPITHPPFWGAFGPHH